MCQLIIDLWQNSASWRTPPAAVVRRPVREACRAGHNAEGGAMRRWPRALWDARIAVLTTRRRGWWWHELERRHRITEIGDAPLQIRAPSVEVVDFGHLSLDCRRVGRQGGLQALEEGLDGGIHGHQVRTRLPHAAHLGEIRQIGAERRVVEWSLIPNVRGRMCSSRSTSSLYEFGIDLSLNYR